MDDIAYIAYVEDMEFWPVPNGMRMRTHSGSTTREQIMPVDRFIAAHDRAGDAIDQWRARFGGSVAPLRHAAPR